MTFKPFGRIQYDVGHVGNPGGVNDRGLGFGNEVRRARIGAEGAIPGGFGYKIEVDFANNDVEITDAFLSYKASKTLGLTIGQHNNFQSIEELTSSRFISFLERAAFTDAFNFERRIGLSATWAKGDIIAQGGVFSDNIEDLSDAQDAVGLGDENNAISFDGRIVYAPKVGKAQLHLGASAHRRDNGDTAAFGPATRYRQRPFVHTSNSRFLATPNMRVGTETDYGIETALIRGPFHAAAEAHWLNADTLHAGSQPDLLRRLCRDRLFPDRREPRLQRRPLGSDQGSQAGRRRRRRRVPDQPSLRPSRSQRRRHRRRPPARLRGLPGLDRAGPCALPAQLRPPPLRRQRDPRLGRRSRLWHPCLRRPGPGRLLGRDEFRFVRSS